MRRNEIEWLMSVRDRMRDIEREHGSATVATLAGLQHACDLSTARDELLPKGLIEDES